jgi:hypothetical protein
VCCRTLARPHGVKHQFFTHGLRSAQIVAYMYQYYACQKFKDLSAVYIPGSLAFLLSTCGKAEQRRS